MLNFNLFINQFFSLIIGGLAYFNGDFDNLLKALICVVILDYITGILSAIYNKNLSSKVGYKGVLKKIFIFLLIALANILDNSIMDNQGLIRTAVIIFYISNEAISVIENAVNIGLPIPEKIKEVLKQVK